MSAVFFSNPAEFRTWLSEHHASAKELHVGFYKKASGRGGLTYQEAVDEALCFGWIDGIIRRIDSESYQHRFTPRKPGSIWSLTNVGHVERLTKAGRMHAAGLAAFAARTRAKTGIYSFENKSGSTKLPARYETPFRTNRSAWEFFQAQSPAYRRNAIHRVTRPKQEPTRERWLTRLIESSAAGRRLPL